MKTAISIPDDLFQRADELAADRVGFGDSVARSALERTEW